MLSEIWNHYGFAALFVLALAVLMGLFVYNVVTGQTGSYMDHSKVMMNLLTLSDPQHLLQSQENNAAAAALVRSRLDGVSGVGGAFESKGEMECRRVAEAITSKSFPKARPNFLRNAISDSNLELDCFNEELRIGIEYNGRQHYEYVPRFHKTKDAFYTTKYRDDMKMRLCKENGVRLIVVPYTVPLNSIESYLVQKFNGL